MAVWVKQADAMGNARDRFVASTVAQLVLHFSSALFHEGSSRVCFDRLSKLISILDFGMYTLVLCVISS